VSGIDPPALQVSLYAAARLVVKKAGKLVEIELRPHNLKRHAATYGSNFGRVQFAAIR